jgi:hypothetical protein
MCRRLDLPHCAITDEFSIKHTNLLLMLTDHGTLMISECDTINAATLTLAVVQEVHIGWRTSI